jgi:hypothetical protein
VRDLDLAGPPVFLIRRMNSGLALHQMLAPAGVHQLILRRYYVRELDAKWGIPDGFPSLLRNIFAVR